MNSRVSRQHFGLIDVLVLVGGIVAAVLIFWAFNGAQQSQRNDATSIQNEAPFVDTYEDLEAAETFVENVDVEGLLDTSEIDAVLSE